MPPACHDSPRDELREWTERGRRDCTATNADFILPLMRTLLAFLLLLLPSLAIAQTEQPIIRQKTVLDFEGDLVEATLENPDFALIQSLKRTRHSNLIQVRVSFDDRILDAAKKID
jgi:hypothetical protein